MISFEHPLLLALLLVPFALPWMRKKISQRKQWQEVNYSSLSIIQKAKMGERILATLPLFFILCALFITALALANPLGEILVKHFTVKGYRIVLAIDVSGSMDTGNRLESAKSASEDLVLKRKTDVFSVIPFSDTALFSSGIPFTTDRDLILRTIQKIETVGSTAVGDGLLAALWLVCADVHAVNGLEKEGIPLPSYEDFYYAVSSKNVNEAERFLKNLVQSLGKIDGAFIVAVTDAESNTGLDPIAVIDFAGRMGLPMYLIGVETPRNEPLAVALVENGGSYFLASSGEEILQMYKAIDRLRPTITNIALVPGQQSFRPILMLAVSFCLLFALLIKTTYLVIE